MSEFLAALAVVAVGGLLTAGAMLLPPAVFEPVGPAAFPLTTGLCLIVLALVWLWQRRLLARQPAAEWPTADSPNDPAERLPLRQDLAWYTVLLTLLYLIVMQREWAGFREATFVYCLVLFVMLSPSRMRAIPYALLGASLLGPGLHWLFTGLFYIALPE